MTIIFDENVPWPLRRYFNDHSVTSVQKEGWGGIQNGALIEKIDNCFDVFLLADKKNYAISRTLRKERLPLWSCQQIVGSSSSRLLRASFPLFKKHDRVPTRFSNCDKIIHLSLSSPKMRDLQRISSHGATKARSRILSSPSCRDAKKSRLPNKR